MRSKKGAKLIVTLFTILFLVFILIIFFILYRAAAKSKAGEISSQFSAVNTDFYLKNFLRSPVGGAQPGMPVIGEYISHADMIGKTCNNKKEYTSRLSDSASKTFDKMYGSDWELWIVYSNKAFPARSFGHTSAIGKILKGIWGVMRASISDRNMMLFKTPYREAGYASQAVPCENGADSAIVILKTSAVDMLDVYKKSAVANPSIQISGIKT
jgi:hypothetical protein